MDKQAAKWGRRLVDIILNKSPSHGLSHPAFRHKGDMRLSSRALIEAQIRDTIDRSKPFSEIWNNTTPALIENFRNSTSRARNAFNIKSTRLPSNVPAHVPRDKFINYVRSRANSLGTYKARPDFEPGVSVSRVFGNLKGLRADAAKAMVVPSTEASMKAPYVGYEPDKKIWRAPSSIEETRNSFATPHPAVAAGYGAEGGRPVGEWPRSSIKEDLLFTPHLAEVKPERRVEALKTLSDNKKRLAGGDEWGNLPDYETVADLPLENVSQFYKPEIGKGHMRLHPYYYRQGGGEIPLTGKVLMSTPIIKGYKAYNSPLKPEAFDWFKSPNN